MSENIEMSTNSTHVEANPKNKKFHLLILFLILVIIIGAGYGFWRLQLLQTEFRQANYAFKVVFVENNKKTALLEAKINNLDKKFQLISSTKVEFYQISELVSLANQILTVYGDINGALRLLNLAEEQLELNNNPFFDKLKLAIGFDISKIQRANKVDSVIISGKLDELNNSVMELHLDHEVADNLPIPTQNSWWKRFFMNIKNTVFAVIKVSEVKNNNVLLPREEEFVRQNIQLNLLNAKIALLKRDEKSWQYSMQNASSLLNTYFSEYANFKEVNTQMTQLGKINITTTDLNINKTINTLNEMRALQN